MKWKQVFCALLSGLLVAGCSAPAGISEEGDAVVVQIDADLNTMDHHIATDASSFIMQSMCFSGLMSLDENGQL